MSLSRQSSIPSDSDFEFPTRDIRDESFYHSGLTDDELHSNLNREFQERMYCRKMVFVLQVKTSFMMMVEIMFYLIQITILSNMNIMLPTHFKVVGNIIYPHTGALSLRQ